MGHRFKSNAISGEEQAIPLQGFYADMLEQQQPHGSPAAPPTHTSPASPPPESLPKTQREETLQKARIVFGSRLAGPGERQAEKDKKAVNIAGILVPPKPEEPDNCCMSGCVNCVWDMFRDDLEDWAAKSAEARAKVEKQRWESSGQKGDGHAMPAHVASSMDDDGGGSETNWSPVTSPTSNDLFKDIPVGIREFMKTEKMLKLRHAQETAASV